MLGKDRSVINIYGGNTSVKLTETNHLDQSVDVLWVKGSGGDLGSMKLAGFATLYMEKLNSPWIQNTQPKFSYENYYHRREE